MVVDLSNRFLKALLHQNKTVSLFTLSLRSFYMPVIDTLMRISCRSVFTAQKNMIIVPFMDDYYFFTSNMFLFSVAWRAGLFIAVESERDVSTIRSNSRRVFASRIVR